MPPDDSLALRALVERYALAVDERRVADISMLFTTDGVLAVPRPPASMEPTAERVGRAAIEEAMASLHRYVATTHAIVGHVVDGDPPSASAATGTTTCIAHHVRQSDDGSLTNIVWGLHYRDTYVVDDGTWRFARRALSVDWIEERPVARASPTRA
jgi:hypothetical protein